MIKTRKDSWTPEDDKLLKEIVLKKIETGHTQISGFEEASILLGRSKQACAFRWNKYIRPIVFSGEVPNKDSHKNESTESITLENHLQLAMENYKEMERSYADITTEYNLLERDYEQLITWIKQGMKFIK